MSWKLVTLGDICRVITKGTTPTTIGHSFQESGVNFIKAEAVTQEGRVDDSTFMFISEETHEKLRRSQIQERDILFSIAGVKLGKSALAKSIHLPANTNQAIAIIRLDDSKAVPEFIHYQFQQPRYYQYVNRVTGQAAQPNINLTEVKRLPIRLPSLPIQKRIASILSAYDDLIENNRRRIQLLEQSARLLYREWFVHLRFPGHEHVKIVDGVPEGWEKKCLSEVCQDIKESIQPGEVDPETPYIGLEHIPRRSIALSTWGNAQEVSSTKFKFQEGDILFGKIRPYFHKVGITFTAGITSIDAIVIRPKTGLQAIVLSLVSSDYFVAVASKTVREGSKMPRADWKYLRDYPVLIPPRPLFDEFSDFVMSIVAHMKILTFQNQKLKQARDLLLPRLMNGEISVTEAKPKPARKTATPEFREAVLIAVLVDRFGTPAYPLGRKRLTKLSYFFHRKNEEPVQDYLRKAAGPYNPKVKYKGPEKIAVENGYIQAHKSRKYAGYIGGKEIDNARQYFGRYYDWSTLNWLESEFKYKTNDELGLYSTVDHALLELAEKGVPLTCAAVKNILNREPEWQNKLQQDTYSDVNIENAIDYLQNLFNYTEMSVRV